MSTHSASPSPLQVAANDPPDEAKMPRGHCRYILLNPEIKGQRCACANFSLNKGIPSATCECGHLACFHNTEPDCSKHELDVLKRRLQQLEDQLSRGQEEVLDSVVSRLNEVEDHLEKSREEFGEQIKGAYRNVSMSWQSIQQSERRSQQHDDQLRQIYDKLRDHDERLDRLHAGQLELRDADLSLEERIENLTETLEEEEELRLSAALAARPPRRRSTSDTNRPSIPLGPLGVGAAAFDTHQHQHQHHHHNQHHHSSHMCRSPAGGPLSNNPGSGDGTGRDGRLSTHPPHHHSNRNYNHNNRLTTTTTTPTTPSSARPTTGAWTVHISLLPHAYVPMPFERNTNAYQRCLSRGLHRMVAVRGRDAASFRAAVDTAFGQFLRGREWIPLQAKLCDAATLQGLPMLRQLPVPPEDGGAGGVGVGERYDHDFLRRHCAVVDPNGVIDSLYIAMRRHTISWHTLRHSPVFMEGLEECWAYDPLLDTDPYDGDMAVDDEDRPAAGDITTAVLPPLPLQQAVVAGIKRPLAEMSRSSSFGSAGGVPPAVGAAAAVTAGGAGAGAAAVEAGGDEARVKRACPTPVSAGGAAPPPPPSQPGAAIVEIRRRDTIKTA